MLLFAIYPIDHVALFYLRLLLCLETNIRWVEWEIEGDRGESEDETEKHTAMDVETNWLLGLGFKQDARE